MNDLKIGDWVVVNDDPTVKYKVVHIKPQPGPDGFVYLCESNDGIRIARFQGQVEKVTE